MGKNVFANGLEISAKASSNRSIAAMPDVCLSPPGPPTGPIPIPYPNSAFARHTTGGSRTVKIGGQEVGKKNISKYSKSTGNEPATRNFGMGVISHNITGPMKFAAWSMDVKVEGGNVTRFMDVTTHNHANPGNGGIVSSVAQAFIELLGSFICASLAEMNDDVRKKTSAKPPIKPDGKPFEILKKRKRSVPYEAVTDSKANAIEVAGTRTVTHAIHMPSCGEARIMKACSNKLAHELFDPSFEVGMTNAEKAARKQPDGRVNSYICGGGKHYYESLKMPPGPWESHTESRILEAIFKKATATESKEVGSLLLCIDWGPNPPPGQRRNPCEASCLPLLCAARQCMEIRRCTEDNKQRDVAEDCKKAGISIPTGPAWKNG